MLKNLLFSLIAIFAITSNPLMAMQPEPAAPAAVAAPRECGICLADEDEDTIFINLACGNAFCIDCLTRQLDVALRDRSTAGLFCSTCRVPIPVEDIPKITQDPNILERLEAVYLKEGLALDGNNLRHCPTPDCPFVFINDGTTRIMIKCQLCPRPAYCSNCLLPHDIRIECQEAARRAANEPTEEERANEEWRRRNTAPCPRCNRNIEKNQGCNHMTCPAPCNNNFCWICLGNWDGSHYACQNHRNPILQPGIIAEAAAFRLRQAQPAGPRNPYIPAAAAPHNHYIPPAGLHNPYIPPAGPQNRNIPSSSDRSDRALIAAAVPTAILALMQVRNYYNATTNPKYFGAPQGPSRWSQATQKTKNQITAPFKWTRDKLQNPSYIEKAKGLATITAGMISVAELAYWIAYNDSLILRICGV